MEERTLLINNLKVNYKIAGSGPAVLDSKEIKILPSQQRDTILILHGWGGSSDSWLQVQEILAKEGYQVICPDFPGFGKSQTPFKPWGVGEYGNWVNDFTEHLNLKKFFIVAHSFGGRVAIKFAINYPEKIKSLVLCASAGIKPKPGLKTRIIFWLARIGNAVLAPRHLARLKDGIRNIFYLFLRHRDYVKANGTMKETVKKVLAEDLLPGLSQIKVRTLVVWGESDRIVPVKYAHIFKEKIKNSELKILPKIGHSPHLEIPEKLSQIILDFLKQ